MKRAVNFVAIGCVAMGATMAWANDKEDRFSLIRAVPVDSWLYVHTAGNPERDFLNKHWSEVFEKVKQAHLERNIKQLILKSIGPDRQMEAEEDLQKAMDLLTQVNWDDLGQQEAVFYFGRIMPSPEFGVLLKPKAETLESNLQGLVSILQELANSNDEVTLLPTEFSGAKIWTLNLGIPVSLNLLHHENVLAFTTSVPSAQAIVTLLESRDSAASLKHSERYKRALEGMPKPEDCIVFMDSASFFNQLETMANAQMQFSSGMEGEESPPTTTQPSPQEIVNAIFKNLNIIDYIISVEHTEGLQARTHSVIRITSEGLEQPLCKMMTRQKSMTNIGRYVPENTQGYNAWSGIDLQYAYHAILDFVRKNIPGGSEQVEQWKQNQAVAQYKIEEDFLSWLDGSVFQISMTPQFPTPMNPSDWIFMLGVKDSEKGSRFINDFVTKMTTPKGEGMGPPAATVMPADKVTADGFQKLQVPMLAMMGVGSLTYGFHDNWLIISNSESALNKSFATSRGESPSLLDSPRYKQEGIPIEGPVQMASFADLNNLGQELAMAMGMLPMTMAFMPPTPETANVREIFAILGKLSPALAELDFMKSSASVCTFRQDRWVSQSVTTYKEYVPKPEQTTPNQVETGDTSKSKRDTATEGL